MLGVASVLQAVGNMRLFLVQPAPPSPCRLGTRGPHRRGGHSEVRTEPAPNPDLWTTAWSLLRLPASRSTMEREGRDEWGSCMPSPGAKHLLLLKPRASSASPLMTWKLFLCPFIDSTDLLSSYYRPNEDLNATTVACTGQFPP